MTVKKKEHKRQSDTSVETLRTSAARMEVPSYSAVDVKPEPAEEEDRSQYSSQNTTTPLQQGVDEVKKSAALVLSSVKQEVTEKGERNAREDADMDDSLVVLRGEDFVVKLDPDYYNESNDYDDLFKDSNSVTTNALHENCKSGEDVRNHHVPSLIADTGASFGFEGHLRLKTESGCNWNVSMVMECGFRGDFSLQRQTGEVGAYGMRLPLVIGRSPGVPFTCGHDTRKDLRRSLTEGSAHTGKLNFQCWECSKSQNCQHSFESQSFQHSLKSQSSQHNLKTQNGQHSFESQSFQHSLKSQSSQHNLKTQNGQHSFESQSCQHILTSQICQHSLKSQSPQHSLKTQNCQHSFESQICQCSLKSQSPQHSLTSQICQHSLKSHGSRFAQKRARTFRCPKCRWRFGCKVDLKVHYEALHLRKVFQCLLCDKKYALRENMRVHYIMAHPQKNRFRCPECHQTFHKLVGLQMHACMPKNTDVQPCHQPGGQVGWASTSGTRVGVRSLAESH